MAGRLVAVEQRKHARLKEKERYRPFKLVQGIPRALSRNHIRDPARA